MLQGRQGGQGDWRGEGEGRRVSGKGRASKHSAGPGGITRALRDSRIQLCNLQSMGE